MTLTLNNFSKFVITFIIYINTNVNATQNIDDEYKKERILKEIGVVVGSRKETSFLSYARMLDDSDYTRFITRLNTDLILAGVKTIFDENHLAHGEMLDCFHNQLTNANSVIMILTRNYRDRSTMLNTGVKSEVDLIKQRMFSRGSNFLIPLLYSGTLETSYPSAMGNPFFADFTNTTPYITNLFAILEKNILLTRKK